MIDPTENDARFDRAARARHQAALDRIAPHTLARLRPRPTPAPARDRPGPWGWSLAGAGAAALALAAGIGTLAPDAPAPSPTAAVQAPAAAAPVAAPDPYRDALAAFEEDPEMFLWLASAEAAPLAME